jgi:hypothetical protein
MTQNINAYKPTFYAQEALELVEQALGMSTRVHRGFDAERKSFNKGDTIRIKKPSTLSTSTGGTSTTEDLVTEYTDITLDNWRQVKFALTDKELAYTGPQIIQDHIAPAAYALAHYIETQVTGLYKYIPWSLDVATPAATSIINARKVLRDIAGSVVDRDTVHFALDSTLEAAFLNLELFHAARIAGEGNQNQALMKGSLGTRFGVEHFVQQTLGSHTSGTVVSTTTGDKDQLGALVGAHTKGATTVSIDTLDADPGTQTIAAGDSFVIAGNSQRYVATALATLTAGANTAVSIFPALVDDYDNDAVVTFETPGTSAGSENYSDAYNYSLMFHRNAFALATAPLPEIGAEAGAKMSTIVNPNTGLSLRSRLAYDDTNAKVIVTLDVLFGVKCLDPNMAVVVRRDYA